MVAKPLFEVRPMRFDLIHGTLPVVLAAVLLAGCAKPAEVTPVGRGEDGHVDAAISTADDEIDMRDLDAIAAKAQAAFDEHVEIGELAFPKGWVRRRMPVLEAAHEVTETDADGQPREAIVRLKYQRLCSLIHPTRDEAADDRDLLPCDPAESRAAMQQAAATNPYEPIALEITYSYQDGRWQRTGWTTQPEVTRGRTWLDRLGVP